MSSNPLPVPYPPEIKALNAALAAAQGEFPPIRKDKTAKAGSYEYHYASLDVIFDAVRPALAKHGLAVIQRLEDHGGLEAIRTEIRHAEGGVIGSSFPIGERPAGPQQLGSLITYLRRYALQAMLGIAPEEDDDGQQAATAKPAAKKVTPRPGPAKEALKVPEGHPNADPKPQPADGPAATPGEVVFSTGRYTGRTIADVAVENRAYVGWAGEKHPDERIRVAAKAFLHDDDIPF